MSTHVHPDIGAPHWLPMRLVPSASTGMRWDIVIGGFRQRENHLTGMCALHYRLLKYQSPRRHVRFLPWRYPWAAASEVIAQMNGGAPVIRVYAYSWGAGWGFLRFARALQDHSLSIEAAVLSDPVYRSPLLPTWLPINPLSITTLFRPVIEIPTNVRHVWALRQRTKRPFGHDLRAQCEQSTTIHCQREIEGVSHAGMDDLPDYHDLCDYVADEDR